VQLSRATWQSFPEIDSVEFVDYLDQSIKDSSIAILRLVATLMGNVGHA
jgi:hypothetical protein